MKAHIGKMKDEEEEEEKVTDCNGESSAVKVRPVVCSLCCAEACTSRSAPVTIKVTVAPTRTYQMSNTVEFLF